MENKLKIALFSDSFLPGVGGMEYALLDIANTLTKLGHKVLVVCPKYGLKKKDLEQEKQNYNFEIHRIPNLKIDSNNYFAWPILSKKLRKTLDNFAPDVLHCHSQASLLAIALKYSKKRNIPLLATIHTKYSFAYSNVVKSKFIVKTMLKMIGKKLKKVDKVTAVSQTMDKEFEQYGYFGDFKVIKNGLSIKDFKITDEFINLAKQNYNIDVNDNNLLFVGHISKVKNLDFTFKAIEKLYEKTKDFKLILVGAGENENYFKDIANKSKAKDNILFTGAIKDKQLLASIYYNAKLFLFPSKFDNDALTILEAANYLTPSITLKGTGPSERITNDVDGFVIDDNPEQMAEIIFDLINNKEKLVKLSENAKNNIVKTWDDVITKYIDLYKEMISKKNSFKSN